MVPNGFYITAAEMRDAGIRVHENISDHTRFVPPTLAEMIERAQIAKRYLNDHEADGKLAEIEGDEMLAMACRRVYNEVRGVLATWRKRWSECRRQKAA